VGNSYTDLLVWRKASGFAVAVYHATSAFPKTEIYGLTNQLRRAAVSVASNIAEGQGRLTTGEFAQFLGHSRGSLLEIETQLNIATELGYLDGAQHRALKEKTQEILYLLNRLLISLRPKQKKKAEEGAGWS
jgi:four helix bundle protein